MSMDELILPLIAALNSLPGVRTYSSCDGHGTNYPYVDFTIDETPESMSSLGIVQEAAKANDWLVFLRSMGPHECTSIFFTMMPIAGIKDKDWIPSNVSFQASNIQDALLERRKINSLTFLIQKLKDSRKAEWLKVSKS